MDKHNQFFIISALLCLGLLLAGCASAAETASPPPPIQPTATNPPTALPAATQTATTEPSPTAHPAATATLSEAELSALFPLSEPGPYYAGSRSIRLVDQSRGNREIEVVFWYPALKEKDAKGHVIRRDAAPDMSGAPYPVVLTENSTGGYILHDHLATHGFVTVQITIPDHDDYFNWDKNMIDWPRDFVFVLDQIAAKSPEGLEGVLDTENVGATGYSYGGDITLTLSGVRIDPEYFLNHCKNPPVFDAAYGGAELYTEWTCNLSKKWDEFAAFAGEEITTSEDGLWQPVTDERIRAVMPMAAAGTWLYGERGLAAADRPALLIAATDDEFIPYTLETAFIFEHLGAPEKSLISFIGKDHMRATDPDQTIRIKHFMTAFFGYHLQGRDDFLEYFSEDFVKQFEDLSWGIYQK